MGNLVSSQNDKTQLVSDSHKRIWYIIVKPIKNE